MTDSESSGDTLRQVFVLGCSRNGTTGGASDMCRIDRLRSGSSEVVIPWSAKEPVNFFRKGESDSWRDDLSNSQVPAIEYIAGDAMDEFGYERMTGATRTPARLWLRERLEWRLSRLTRRLENWLARL